MIDLIINHMFNLMIKLTPFELKFGDFPLKEKAFFLSSLNYKLVGPIVKFQSSRKWEPNAHGKPE